ncbi:MAG: PEP/pyruvate-binding domain-containing protein, partial [Acidimicrobiales bacterium]|nr:PEP/pyruvate-binding domain-containing protein [Acidimicrobiales bacterium]
SVGGKGANLGELTRGGFPVPPGFVITADAFTAAMDAGGVRDELRTLAAEVDPSDTAAFAEACATLRRHVGEAGIPDDLAAEIRTAYEQLGRPLVAVRSSATGEDSADTSFAGMNETFTDVLGDDDLLAKVVACWQSVYGDRVVAYRLAQGVDREPAIAVVVQQMVASERSGVMFSADPSTGDRTHVVIEAALGLGEVVVGGLVEPDTYVVDKGTGRIVSTRVG